MIPGTKPVELINARGLITSPQPATITRQVALVSYRIEEAAYSVNTIPLATIMNRRSGVVSGGSISFVSTTVLSKTCYSDLQNSSDFHNDSECSNIHILRFGKIRGYPVHKLNSSQFLSKRNPVPLLLSIHGDVVETKPFNFNQCFEFHIQIIQFSSLYGVSHRQNSVYICTSCTSLKLAT